MIGSVNNGEVNTDSSHRFSLHIYRFTSHFSSDSVRRQHTQPRHIQTPDRMTQDPHLISIESHSLLSHLPDRAPECARRSVRAENVRCEQVRVGESGDVQNNRNFCKCCTFLVIKWIKHSACNCQKPIDSCLNYQKWRCCKLIANLLLFEA